jgi:4-hydroxythreonine-4-phosphate dehydrogenase
VTPLLLTPGDPRGIGPEVALGALAARTAPRRVVVVGDRAAMTRAAAVVSGPPIGWRGSLAEALDDEAPISGFDPGDEVEPVEVASLRVAVAACLAGTAAGLVTGPIHKARLAARGFRHAGHTDFLGELCGVRRPVMAFVGGELRVALVTVHVPLRAVADALTTDGVAHTVREADAALRRWLGIDAPRLLVCGLNPHAGDGGLLGREEIDVIAPAVAACRAAGVDVHGPVSAEAAFRLARAGRYDLVVAMYHDQGLAPLKLVDFGRSVNWTLGLPILRVSVDHGTADDIAGKGVADATSMIAALGLADTLVARA